MKKLFIFGMISAFIFASVARAEDAEAISNANDDSVADILNQHPEAINETDCPGCKPNVVNKTFNRRLDFKPTTPAPVHGEYFKQEPAGMYIRPKAPALTADQIAEIRKMVNSQTKLSDQQILDNVTKSMDQHSSAINAAKADDHEMRKYTRELYLAKQKLGDAEQNLATLKANPAYNPSSDLATQLTAKRDRAQYQLDQAQEHIDGIKQKSVRMNPTTSAVEYTDVAGTGMPMDVTGIINQYNASLKNGHSSNDCHRKTDSEESYQRCIEGPDVISSHAANGKKDLPINPNTGLPNYEDVVKEQGVAPAAPTYPNSDSAQ